MGIMTGFALSFGNRAVHKFLALDLLADISHSVGTAGIILTMAVITEVLTFLEEQGRIIGKMGQMAITALFSNI